MCLQGSGWLQRPHQQQRCKSGRAYSLQDRQGLGGGGVKQRHVNIGTANILSIRGMCIPLVGVSVLSNNCQLNTWLM
jgi:hypothetical protein